MLTELCSFDGTELVHGELCRPDRYRRLFTDLDATGAVIPRGAGLSYCSASAGTDVRSVTSQRFDRILEFDPVAGTVRVEAGIRLGRLFAFCVRRGWIPAVLPGHPDITVGGCIGCNVHGKNHARDGNFVNVVERLRLFHPDHGELECSPTEHQRVFDLTVGGFGLTGFVTEATLRLAPLEGTSVEVRRSPAADLLDAVEQLEGGSGVACYSWHNFNLRGQRFGRGYVYHSRIVTEPEPAWAAAAATWPEAGLKPRPLSAKWRGQLPVGRLADWAVRNATRVYDWSQRLARPRAVKPLGPATFPIQGKEVYFRMFGRRGFREYQMLVPCDRFPETARRVGELVERHAVTVGLASLKLFRSGRPPKFLHFDGDGICLAIDTPAAPRAAAFFADLDRWLLGIGGLANIAKDSRLSAEVVRRMYPEYDLFKAELAAFDPRRRFDSELRRRLDV